MLVADERADALPTGLARLCELGRALATRPRLLLLDEPASGLSDRETETFAELLRALAADGMAVLLVEHDVGLVMSVCASVHVIDYGALVSVGTPEEIRRNQAVLDAYLGRRIDARRSRNSAPTRAALRARRATPPGRAGPVPVLELRGITAAYGKIEVLHGIDLVLPRGDVVALLGPNGSGKSTTLKVASGQMKPSGGCIHVGGRHVNGAAGDALARIGLCTIPEGRGVFPNLTVRENLVMASYVGLPLGPIEERTYAFFPRLEQRRSQLAGTLSGGEQRMLAMARALVTEPAVLLLDEMSMGLAPLIVEELYGLVDDIAKSGVSILVGRTVRPHRARRRGPRGRHGAGQDRRCRPPLGHRNGTVVGLLGSEAMSEHEVLLLGRLAERVGSRRAVPGRRVRVADPEPDGAPRAQVVLVGSRDRVAGLRRHRNRLVGRVGHQVRVPGDSVRHLGRDLRSLARRCRRRAIRTAIRRRDFCASGSPA